MSVIRNIVVRIKLYNNIYKLNDKSEQTVYGNFILTDEFQLHM